MMPEATTPLTHFTAPRVSGESFYSIQSLFGVHQLTNLVEHPHPISYVFQGGQMIGSIASARLLSLFHQPIHQVPHTSQLTGSIAYAYVPGPFHQPACWVPHTSQLTKSIASANIKRPGDQSVSYKSHKRFLGWVIMEISKIPYLLKCLYFHQTSDCP